MDQIVTATISIESVEIKGTTAFCSDPVDIGNSGSINDPGVNPSSTIIEVSTYDG
jgi:hypothetical protein